MAVTEIAFSMRSPVIILEKIQRDLNSPNLLTAIFISFAAVFCFFFRIIDIFKKLVYI